MLRNILSKFILILAFAKYFGVVNDPAGTVLPSSVFHKFLSYVTDVKLLKLIDKALYFIGRQTSDPVLEEIKKMVQEMSEEFRKDFLNKLNRLEVQITFGHDERYIIDSLRLMNKTLKVKKSLSRQQWLNQIDYFKLFNSIAHILGGLLDQSVSNFGTDFLQKNDQSTHCHQMREYLHKVLNLTNSGIVAVQYMGYHLNLTEEIRTRDPEELTELHEKAKSRADHQIHECDQYFNFQRDMAEVLHGQEYISFAIAAHLLDYLSDRCAGTESNSRGCHKKPSSENEWETEIFNVLTPALIDELTRGVPLKKLIS